MEATTNTITWERDSDGIVILTFDDPGQSANTLNDAHRASMVAAVDRLEAEKDEIAGVVLTSAKNTFFAGGDLRDIILASRETLDELAEQAEAGKAQLRRLERLGRPVVAAINGTALGGGLEITLACHRRICIDDPRIRLGFPEVSLGLLPGFGGVVRSVRMLGVRAALRDWLLSGKKYGPREAMELGLVDELAAGEDELIAAAKAWVAAQGGAFEGQPWDRPGYAIPGGTPARGRLATEVAMLPATLRKQLKGARYPAQAHIMAAAVEGSQVAFDAAAEIEARYFLDLATGQIAKNMVQAYFFDTQAVAARSRRGAAVEPYRATKAVVLGGGKMGAAIAYTCAEAGIEVVLKEIDQDAAERGREYGKRVVAESVARGRMGEERAAELLRRIVPTADPADAAGADLVIEAVVEDLETKSRALAEVDPHLAAEALLATTTATLPVAALADGVRRPDALVGLHFTSPVERTPLLEIVKGERTSDEHLGRALGFARQLRKTAIVVNDSRGLLTLRLISTFHCEGIGMLLEGVPAASIEQASSQAGFPAPVLRSGDELMGFLRRIVAAAAADDCDFANAESSGALAVVERMAGELGRPGRRDGRGFYDYPDGEPSGLWAGLAEAFPPITDPQSLDLEELQERMLFATSIEAVKCFEEGVVESVAEANVGSLLGAGFPAWTGGVLQYIDGYRHEVHGNGSPGFTSRARELAKRYGPRFEPPAPLMRVAGDGALFSDLVEGETQRG